MAAKRLTFILCLLAFAFNVVLQVQGEKRPPSYNGSFRAIGELARRNDDNDGYSTAYFEENFDLGNLKASLVVNSFPIVVKLIDNFLMNKKFFLIDRLCTVLPNDTTQDEATLNIATGPNGSLYFFVREFLSLPSDKATYLGNQEIGGRGHRVDVWRYNLQGKVTEEINETHIVTAAWSDEDKNSTSYPVSLELEVIQQNRTSNAVTSKKHLISVFHFMHNNFDESDLEVPDGIYCSEFRYPDSPPFPNTTNWKSISYNLEMNYYEEENVRTSEVWIDIDKGLYEIDYDPIDDIGRRADAPDKDPSYRLVISRDLDSYYKIPNDIALPNDCAVEHLSDLKFDFQMVFDPKLIKVFTEDVFFGLDKSKYNFMRETEKHGISCSLWKGLRTDWPLEKAPNITTIWEWCFTKDVEVQMSEKGYHLATLDIIVDSNLSAEKDDFYTGMKLSYVFYDMKKSIQSDVMDVLAFDITDCFAITHYDDLQFTLDLSPNDFLDLKSYTNTLTFLALWKAALIEASTTEPSKMRIQKMASMVVKDVIVVQFRLLDRHPDLPTEERRNEVSIIEARKNITSKIDEGNLSINFELNSGTKMSIKARKGSLVDTPTDVVTPAPTNSTDMSSESSMSSVRSMSSVSSMFSSSETSTSPNITSTLEIISTDTPMSTGKTNPTTPKPIVKIEDNPSKKYSSGSMAGIGIAMLVIGFGLGAGGTFAKYRYLPDFQPLSRRK